MHGWFAGYVAPLAVLFFLRPGQDAWHLGRFVSEGQLSALAYARLVCWLPALFHLQRAGSGCRQWHILCPLSYAGQASLHSSGVLTVLQVHVSTSGVLTLGYVTNAGAGYWKVLNSWGFRGVSRVTSVSSAARAVRMHVVSLRFLLVQVLPVLVVFSACFLISCAGRGEDSRVSSVAVFLKACC